MIHYLIEASGAGPVFDLIHASFAIKQHFFFTARATPGGMWAAWFRSSSWKSTWSPVAALPADLRRMVLLWFIDVPWNTCAQGLDRCRMPC